MKYAKMTAYIAAAAVAVSSVALSASAVELNKIDGAAGFTYEAGGKAWAHIWNPYNEASLFDVPSNFAEGTKDLIVKFTVSGMTDGESYTVFPGFQCHGDAVMDDGEELSIWNQDDYQAAGSTYDYTVNGNGDYELIVPMKGVADAIDLFWGESIHDVNILELCFEGVANEETTGPVNESLVIEFTGVEECSDIHSVADCAFAGLAVDEPATDEPETDAPATDEPETDAPTADEPETDAPAQTDKPNTDTGAEGIAVAAAVAVIAAGVAIVAKKHR